MFTLLTVNLQASQKAHVQLHYPLGHQHSKKIRMEWMKYELHNKVVSTTITSSSVRMFGSIGLGWKSFELLDIKSKIFGKGMMGFTKLFDELLNSSLFVPADDCILAMDSKDGPAP